MCVPRVGGDEPGPPRAAPLRSAPLYVLGWIHVESYRKSDLYVVGAVSQERAQELAEKMRKTLATWRGPSGLVVVNVRTQRPNRSDLAKRHIVHVGMPLTREAWLATLP